MAFDNMPDREQAPFGSTSSGTYRRPTKLSMFLREVNVVIPWNELLALIEPHYPKEERPGRPATPLIWMLKLYLYQMWYSLTDQHTEEMIYDSFAVQEFLGLDIRQHRPPDKRSILRFRHLLDTRNLGTKVLEIANTCLEQAGIQVPAVKIVEPKIIRISGSRKKRR